MHAAWLQSNAPLHHAPEAVVARIWGVLRTSSAAKAVAIVASGAVHAAAFALAAPGAAREGRVDLEIPVLVENIEPSTAPAPPPTPDLPRAALPDPPARTRSSARVELTHAVSEAHAAASVEHVVAAEAPPVIARSSVESPPRFVIVLGRGERAGHVVGTTPDEGIPANHADAILPVEEVTTPARLLAGSPPHYPMGRRASGVEADVRLELVVDSAGRVQSTRVLGMSSPDFDAAALDAVAGYRFTPAMLNGHPVKVRMKWSVEFRLN